MKVFLDEFFFAIWMKVYLTFFLSRVQFFILSQCRSFCPACLFCLSRQQVAYFVPFLFFLSRCVFFVPLPVEGMLTKHLLQELGHEVILMNHVDSQFAKAWASMRGLMNETRDAEIHVRATVVVKKLTNLAYINTKQNKADLMTKCHKSEAHYKNCAMMGVRFARNRIERWRSNAKMKRREKV